MIEQEEPYEGRLSRTVLWERRGETPLRDPTGTKPYKKRIENFVSLFKATFNMNLSAEKLDIIQKICEIQDNDLLDIIKKIIYLPTDSKSDWWNQISQDEKNSINRGLDDLAKGRVHSHEQIRKKYEKWLKD